MISTLLLVALSQTPQHWLFRQPNLPTSSYAFFEFAPASGAGMGAVCACTTPTGAKGEALTFTRGSSATCTKTATGGLATSGIANGDLVTCTTDQPRVEYDSAGTLGLLVESARTNSLVRSQEINNAGWTKGAAVGTITPDYAVAPDGTTTAERYQYSNTNNDYVLQAFSVGGLAASASVYLKGTSGSGTIYLCRGGAGSQCVTCSYTATDWSRCRYEATLTTSANVFLGCETGTLGGACAQTGLDVLVWGFQAEVGTYATSYMATGAAAANRLAETSYLTLSAAMSQEPMSLAYSVSQTLPASGYTGDRIGVMTRALSGSGDFVAGYFQAQFRCDAVGSAAGSATSGGTSVAGDRWACSHDSDVTLAFKNGAQTATNTTAKTMSAATVIGVGGSPAGASLLDGIVSRVCADPSATRCR